MASLLSYGACQTACNAGVVTCYAAAGLTFGTVTAGIGAPAAALACNSIQATCMAACATKFLAEGSAETAATGGVMGPVVIGGGIVMSALAFAAGGTTAASAATTAGAAGTAAGAGAATTASAGMATAGGVATVGGMTAARVAMTALLGIGIGTAVAAGAYGAYVVWQNTQGEPRGVSKEASDSADASESGQGSKEAEESEVGRLKQLACWFPQLNGRGDKGGEGQGQGPGHSHEPQPEAQQGGSQQDERGTAAGAAQCQSEDPVPFPLDIRVQALDFDSREGTVVSIENGLVGVDFGIGVGQRLVNQERLVVVCSQSGQA